MDLDNVPIGIKPTNKMPFEQLIEEKLKMQSELDQEQARFGSSGSASSRPRSSKTNVLKKRSGVSTSSLNAAASGGGAAAAQTVSPAPSTSSVAEIGESEIVTPPKCVQPKKFLRKGEGLMRFQPGSAKRMQQQRQQNRNKKYSIGGGTVAATTNNSTAKSSSSSEAFNKPLNRVVSTAERRQQQQQLQLTNKSTSNRTSKVTIKPQSSQQTVQIENKMQLQQQQHLQRQQQVENIRHDEDSGRSPTESSSSENQEHDEVYEEEEEKEEEIVEYKPIRVESDFNKNVNATYNQKKIQEEFDEYQTRNFQDEDEELREFEKLEKYTEEHASFRSSISYVETFLNLQQYQQKQRQQQQPPKSQSQESSLTKKDNIERLLEQIKAHPELGKYDFSSLRNELMLLSAGGEEIAEEDEGENESDETTTRLNQSPSTSSTTSSAMSPDMGAADYSFNNSNGMVRKVKRIDEKKKKATSLAMAADDDDDGVDDYAGYQSENYKDNDEDDEQDECQLKYFGDNEDKNNDVDKDMTVYERILKLTEPPKLTFSKEVKFDDTSTWEDMVGGEPKHAYASVADGQRMPSQSQSQSQPALTKQQSSRQVGHSQPNAIVMPSLISDRDRQEFDRIRRAQYNGEGESRAAASVLAPSSVNASANLLREKLNQLEAEIEKFRAKNAELTERTRQLDVERRQLETERRVFDKEKRDEMTRLRDIHDEEMRKLRVEKKTFEQYRQSIKDKPTRKERDEIEMLKKQIAEMTEEMKLRESRWAANNNRMKERIETLEREKIELKESLRIAEKHRMETLNKLATSASINSNLRSATPTQQQTSRSMKSPQSSIEHDYVSYSDRDVFNVAPWTTSDYNQQPQASVVSANLFQENNSNGMFMRRTTSEKSFLPNSARMKSSSSSSSSSAASTSSSSSIGSTSGKVGPRRQQSAPYILTNHAAAAVATTTNTANQHSSTSSTSSLESLSTNPTKSPPTAPAAAPSVQKSVTWSLERNSVEIIHYDDDEATVDLNQSHSAVSAQPPLKRLSNDSEASSRLGVIREECQPVPTRLVSPSMPPQPDYQSPPPVEYAVATLSGVERRLKVLQTRRFDDGHYDKLLDDGTLLTIFANGTIKEISPDKKHILVKFYNGDRKEVDHESDTETYYYHETNITQIFYGTGPIVQVVHFPNGQVEKHHRDHKCEIIFPDTTQKIVFADGSEETRLPNGTVVRMRAGGLEKLIEHPNGNREVHTSEYKKREYADGSVKIMYIKTGLCESRYANGRIRIKDAKGNVISDTHVTPAHMPQATAAVEQPKS